MIFNKLIFIKVGTQSSRGFNANGTFTIPLVMTPAHIVLLFCLAPSNASSTVLGHSIPNLWVCFRYLVLCFSTRDIMWLPLLSTCDTHNIKLNWWPMLLANMYLEFCRRETPSHQRVSPMTWNCLSIDNIHEFLAIIDGLLFIYAYYCLILMCIQKALQ